MRPEVAANFDFQWRPDGSGFYLTTNLDREFNAVAYYELATDELTTLFATDADSSNVQLSEDGNFLLWTTNQEGYSNLQGLDLISQKPIQVPQLPHGVYEIDVSASGDVVTLKLDGPGTWGMYMHGPLIHLQTSSGFLLPL